MGKTFNGKENGPNGYKRVLPFNVRLKEGKSNVFVRLPEVITLISGEKVYLDATVEVQADGRSNLQHNLRRDVRRYLREEYQILVPFKEQNELIKVS